MSVLLVVAEAIQDNAGLMVVLLVVVDVDVVLGVVVEVALIEEMDVEIVVVIMGSDVVVMTPVEVLDVISSLVVFGKVVKLSLVVVSLSGALMITEGVVAVLGEDSPQRAVKVSSHVVFPGQLLQGSPTLSNLFYVLIIPQKTTLRSKKRL